MNPQGNEARSAGLPMLAAIALLGGLSLLLLVLIGAEAGNVRQAQSRVPLATTVPTRAPATPAPLEVAQATSEATAALDATSALDTVTSPEATDAPQGVARAPLSGEAAYTWACATCHGVDGQGNPPYGPGLADSDLLQPEKQAELVAFLVGEHPPMDPREGFPHPARGGYPVLSDDEIANLVNYLHEQFG